MLGHNTVLAMRGDAERGVTWVNTQLTLVNLVVYDDRIKGAGE